MVMRSFFPVPLHDPNPNPVVPAAAWHVGKIDEAGLGWLQQRGLADKSVEEVAVNAITAHREATKMLSIPQDQLLRMPKEPGDPEWNTLWKKLGRPDDPKGYDFSTIKTAKGADPAPEVMDALRAAAHANNIPAAAAIELAKTVVKTMDGLGDAQNVEKAGKLAEAKAKLDKDWGLNKEANMLIARKAAAALGVAPEAVIALEGVAGYDVVMEMFRQIGTKIGEDRFIKSDNPATPGVMTKAEAGVKKAELLADAQFVDRYLKSGTASKEWKQLDALDRIILA